MANRRRGTDRRASAGVVVDAETGKRAPTDFNQIRVGAKKLRNDVASVIDDSTRAHRPFRQADVFRAIETHDLKTLRAMSHHFFEKSGIYSRLCRYMAYFYRYDWVVTPIARPGKSVNRDRATAVWYDACEFLERCRVKKTFGDVALKVVKNGCWYGYMLDGTDTVSMQELPVDYCRSRYSLNGQPAVEFNVKYFDDQIKDGAYRMRVVGMFPPEVRSAYVKYKEGTLEKDYSGDTLGWVLLDPEKTVKFNLSGTDMPLFISVIPAILDLEDAQDLDKKKMAQQILKIVIQKMPLDKNYDLVFDISESQAMHNNAVQMLADAIGVDVLTTFADTEVADLSDNGNASSVDQLERVERTVYNNAGVSQAQFNTDSSVALEKSIKNDESTMYDLVLQFEAFLNRLLAPYDNKVRGVRMKASILPTTVYNYADLAQTYKEQTSLGFSKLLPQVALGRTQTEVIATAAFENDWLDLNSLFVPPQMSSTISSDGASSGGRPELDDEDKSSKTVANIESE
jgi:hypothetical protein